MFRIDTHTHIDFFENFEEAILQYQNQKIYTIFVTNLPELYDLSRKKVNSSFVRIAIGYHPLLIKKYKFNEKLFKELLSTTNYIGEVGLDNRNSGMFNNQKVVFNRICGLAEGRLLNIHSRKAEREVLEILETNKIKNAIFHWYTGPLDLIKKILDAGYYFSINPKMLETKSGRGILKRISTDRILFESDAPFTQYENEHITPKSFETIYKKLSEFYKCKYIEDILYKNFKELLNKVKNSMDKNESI